MAESQPPPTPALQPKKTFTGSCHCKAVRYEVQMALPVPPESPKAGRCNCTICLKLGFTSFQLPDPADFKLISPASSDELGNYQANNNKDINRYFCKTCAVYVYWQGAYVFEGKSFPFFGVDLGSLDQPQEGLDLSQFKINYIDGRNDNWMAGAKDVPWPGGLV